MKLRWKIWLVFAVIFALLDLWVLSGSIYEQRVHGYDGGYFFLFLAMALVSAVILFVWAILNKAL